MLVGVLSDTHGLLRPEAARALAGAELILHAGDVGSPKILPQLERIAPVHAVRGNVDTDPWADRLPIHRNLRLDGVRVHIVHIREDARADGADVVIFGHSHQPLVETLDDTIWFNPGSAGPRRFRLPISVGLLHIEGGRARAELIEIQLNAR